MRAVPAALPGPQRGPRHSLSRPPSSVHCGQSLYNLSCTAAFGLMLPPVAACRTLACCTQREAAHQGALAAACREDPAEWPTGSRVLCTAPRRQGSQVRWGAALGLRGLAPPQPSVRPAHCPSPTQPRGCTSRGMPPPLRHRPSVTAAATATALVQRPPRPPRGQGCIPRPAPQRAWSARVLLRHVCLERSEEAATLSVAHCCPLLQAVGPANVAKATTMVVEPSAPGEPPRLHAPGMPRVQQLW